MLKTDPNKRPNINQILKIDFIKDRITTLLNEDDFKEIEADEEVVVVTSFIGAGMPRFISTLLPEQPNPAMAQLVIRVRDVELMNDTMRRVDHRLAEVAPHAQIMVRRAEFSSSGSSKMEARFSGPDDAVLRHLAAQALDVYLNHDLVNRATDAAQTIG